MRLNNKIKIFYSNLDLIFKIKVGKVIKKDNECYQVSKWIRWFFIVYYGGIFFYVMMMIWIFIVEHFTNNLYIIIILTTLVYLLFEFLITLFIPLYKIKCWKVSKKWEIRDVS